MSAVARGRGGLGRSSYCGWGCGDRHGRRARGSLLDRRLDRLGRKSDSCGGRSSGNGIGTALTRPGLWSRRRGRLGSGLLWRLNLLGLDGRRLRMLNMMLLLNVLGLDVLRLVCLRLGCLLNVLGVLVHVLRLYMLGMLGMLRMLLLLSRVLRHGHRRLDGALVLLLVVLLGRGLLAMCGCSVGAIIGCLAAAIQVRLGILVLSAVPGAVSKGRLLLGLHRIQGGLGLRP